MLKIICKKENFEAFGDDMEVKPSNLMYGHKVHSHVKFVLNLIRKCLRTFVNFQIFIPHK